MHSTKVKENIIYLVLWVLVLVGYVLHLYEEWTARSMTLTLGKCAACTCRTLLPLVGIFLINNSLLIPALIRKNRIWQYVLCVLAVIAVYGIFEYYGFARQLEERMMRHGMENIRLGAPFGHRPPHGPHHIPMPVVYSTFNAILVIGVNLAIWLLGRNISLSFEKKTLEAANIQGQLDRLKAQINPHFYMNTLNSIHGLIDINPSKAKELVIEMSRLMRYLLYDSSKDRVSLASELTFLKEYIRIITDRYPDGKVDMSVCLPDEKDVEHIMIPPLLFIVFIENAFKYGVDYRYDSRVAIRMELDGNGLHFSCLNFKHPADDDMRLKRGGIGLANVRKRLALIYGGRESLRISDNDNQYLVNLTIPLDEAENNNN